MLAAVALLLIIGLMALYSISYEDAHFNSTNFNKQLLSSVLGIILLFFLSFYDYRVLGSYSSKFYFAILIILALVIFFGTTVRGTTGWIGLGSYHIQPVEMAKLVMIIFLASFFSKKKNQLSIIVRIAASVILVFVPIFLILNQPDFGSAAIIVGSWAVMLSISGVNKKNLLILAMCGTLAVSSSWFFLKTYQKERVINFINPERDPRGSGYNVIQSIVAVGSGSLLGKGLGHGSQSQLNFLPEKHTDFIFAVISEELGLLGASAVFVLFGIVFWRAKEAARLARDNFGYLLSVGIITMLFLQILVNIGMNIGVMPVAGVPLPLLSYGGSSLLAVLASLGIIQSVYLRRVRNIDSSSLFYADE